MSEKKSSKTPNPMQSTGGAKASQPSFHEDEDEGMIDQNAGPSRRANPVKPASEKKKTDDDLRTKQPPTRKDDESKKR